MEGIVSKSYDAIVVGARCAGSPTAMLLARQGYRVLLVDRSSFPSDTISTLAIHATGLGALERWGLLDSVRATGCPPIATYSFDFGPIAIAGTPRAVDGITGAYAPRRTVLDKILLDAAAGAGAEVRERFTVEEIVVEDGRVVGVRGRDEHGKPVVDRARVVVGADGHNSRVARAVDAEIYRDLPVLEYAFYTFWSGLPIDGFPVWIRGDRGIAALPTNDDLTLMLVGCPAGQAAAFKADVEGNYLAAIDRVPELADRLRAATREDRFRVGGVPNFFRKPFGPGWALVGDAGYTRDPVTAQGITDAFIGAEQCTRALTEAFEGIQPFEQAMAGYQRARDARVTPIYEFTTQLATLEPPPPEMQQLLGAVARSQPAMDAFVSVVGGSLPPAEFFSPAHIETIMAAAAA
ncbi:MAG TPA: NAD(P)/FAD-dependent oxidoreductase [Acidimicrobiales bacterium]|nr:NAD(P)/FAD-dependent oxidoreductase [Acidimicrobiales bacterium]